MRTMQHNSRANAKGKVHGTKHNDRNFDLSLADNIDANRSDLNTYWHCFNDQAPGLTFEEAELKCYQDLFGHQLQKTNQSYINNGHPERCKTMETWKKIKRHAPEETTLQIGKMEEHVNAATLMRCFVEYNARLGQWNDEHGRPFTQLSYALHDDEAVPHIQTRRVWHYRDEDGLLRIGQEKALRAAGVQLPNPEEPEGRLNNRKVSFDKMAREMWLDVLYEHGLDVERDALPDGKHNRDKEDMIRDKYNDMLQEATVAHLEAQRTRSELVQLQQQLEASRREAREATEVAISLKDEVLGLRKEATALQDENVAMLAILQEQNDAIMENQVTLENQHADIDEINAWMLDIPDWPTYTKVADEAVGLLEAFKRLLEELFNSTLFFRNRKGERGVLEALDSTKMALRQKLSMLLGYEAREFVEDSQQRSKHITRELDRLVSNAQEKAGIRQRALPQESKKDISLD